MDVRNRNFIANARQSAPKALPERVWRIQVVIWNSIPDARSRSCHGYEGRRIGWVKTRCGHGRCLERVGSTVMSVSAGFGSEEAAQDALLAQWCPNSTRRSILIGFQFKTEFRDQVEPGLLFPSPLPVSLAVSFLLPSPLCTSSSPPSASSSLTAARPTAGLSPENGQCRRQRWRWTARGSTAASMATRCERKREREGGRERERETRVENGS